MKYHDGLKSTRSKLTLFKVKFHSCKRYREFIIKRAEMKQTLLHVNVR